MRIIITIAFLLLGVSSNAYSRQDIMQYIDLYKLIAVEEMEQCGIPASIKMAQAILESNAGMSDLAQEANNHFGIKCGGYWDGPTFYKEDDDRDKKGRLIKSCFRVFENAESSFREHSQFLMDPKKSYRYGPLFELDKTDYKSWAWGLRKAGYATNPAYANLLINIIEKYSLYTFDYYESTNVNYVKPADLFVQAREIPVQPKLEAKKDNKIISIPGESVSNSAIERSAKINDREVLMVRKGQTMEQLAKKYDLSPQQILKFNDNNREIGDYLDEGMFVYIEKKRRTYRGSDSYHIVKKGEDLYQISQKYGVRLSTLERKNKIDASMIPLPGQKIILRGRSARGDDIPLTYDDVDIIESSSVSKPVLVDSLETRRTPGDAVTKVKADHKNTTSEKVVHQEVLQIKPTTSAQSTVDSNEKGNSEVLVFDLTKSNIADPSTWSHSNDATTEDDAPVATGYHVVKGDTLYSISRKFEISVDAIRQANNLTTDQISIGQTLIIIH